jgi:hypothetical protein
MSDQTVPAAAGLARAGRTEPTTEEDIAYLHGLAEDTGEDVCECGAIRTTALADPGRLHFIADRYAALLAECAATKEKLAQAEEELTIKQRAHDRTYRAWEADRERYEEKARYWTARAEKVEAERDALRDHLNATGDDAMRDLLRQYLAENDHLATVANRLTARAEERERKGFIAGATWHSGSLGLPIDFAKLSEALDDDAAARATTGATDG